MENRLTFLLGEAAHLKIELDAVEASVKAKKQSYDDMRLEIQELMSASRSKRTESVEGYYAVRTETKKLVVTDPDALAAWIAESDDYDVDDFKAFDVALVKGLAAKVMDETGEIIDGLTTHVTESIQLRKDK